MIRKALEKIGLTAGEIQVYEALIELGISSTGAVTKKAQISSSKVYEVLQRLMKKGLVSYMLKNGVRYYEATPPERLIDFLEEKKESIERAQQEVKRIIPALKRIRKAAHEENKTVVYTGVQGPKIVLKEIIEAAKKGEANYGYGTNEDPYVKYFPAQLKQHIEESRKYKVKTKLIFAEGFKSPNVTAEVRFLPLEYFSPVRIMIYGHKVAIVDFTKPMTTIIIEKREIAKAYKKHFATLWNLAKKE